MRDVGLVLCGGGGRGAYQIGVWKAMQELGFMPDIAAVSGTSVGALNAALFVSKTPQQAEEIWCSIRQQDLTDFGEIASFDSEKILESLASSLFNIVNNVITDKGIFSREGLRRIIVSNNICKGVLTSPIPVYACYKRADNGSIIYKDMRDCATEDEVLEVLFASSSIPVIFQMQKHDSNYNIDGGFYGDNTPIEPLYNMGLRKFIILALDPKEDFRFTSKYYDSEILIVRPTDSIYLGFNGETILTNGTIDFNGRNAERRIKLGYHEAMYQFNNDSLYYPQIEMNGDSDNYENNDDDDILGGLVDFYNKYF